MDDPIRRVSRLANTQAARKDQNEAAKEEWREKMPQLVIYVQKLVGPLKADHGVIAVVIPGGILIKFDMHVIMQPGGGFAHEDGAEAFFMCQDGQVWGIRSPAHLSSARPPLERFVCIGAPAEITEEILGNAVAEFLEWGAAGEGRSRFATPL